MDVTGPEGGLCLRTASIPACSRAPSLLGFFINRQQQQGGGRGESGRVTPSTAYAAGPSSSRLPTQIPEAPKNESLSRNRDIDDIGADYTKCLARRIDQLARYRLTERQDL